MLPIDFYCALAQAWDGSGALLVAIVSAVASRCYCSYVLYS